MHDTNRQVAPGFQPGSAQTDSTGKAEIYSHTQSPRASHSHPAKGPPVTDSQGCTLHPGTAQTVHASCRWVQLFTALQQQAHNGRTEPALVCGGISVPCSMSTRASLSTLQGSVLSQMCSNLRCENNDLEFQFPSIMLNHVIVLADWHRKLSLCWQPVTAGVRLLLKPTRLPADTSAPHSREGLQGCHPNKRLDV